MCVCVCVCVCVRGGGGGDIVECRVCIAGSILMMHHCPANIIWTHLDKGLGGGGSLIPQLEQFSVAYISLFIV